jgi:hypothetical protein
MSVKDFFKVVLKVLAIYIFLEGIYPLVTSLICFEKVNKTSDLFTFIGVILIFLAFIYFMLSHTERIVTFLRLDKGFETTTFNFSKTESNYVVEIALALVGVYMVFERIPGILQDVYALVKSNINSYSFSFRSPEMLKENLYTDLLYILVGIIIIFLRKPIANIFTSKS